MTDRVNLGESKETVVPAISSRHTRHLGTELVNEDDCEINHENNQTEVDFTIKNLTRDHKSEDKKPVQSELRLLVSGDVESRIKETQDNVVVSVTDSSNHVVSHHTVMSDPDESLRPCTSTYSCNNETSESPGNSANNGSTLTSLLSFFQVVISGDTPKGMTARNNNNIKNNDNEGFVHELRYATPYHNNFLNEGVSCCPFGTPNTKDKTVPPLPREGVKNVSSNGIVNISPKLRCRHIPQVSQISDSQSSQMTPSCSPLGDTSPISVSSEQVYPSQCVSSHGASWSNSTSDSGDLFSIKNGEVTSPILNVAKPACGKTSPTKLKLVHEGDISVCFINHSKTIISKVLTSKFLRRWTTHHLYLQDDLISSKTPNGLLETPISYSNVEEVYSCGRWEQSNKPCVRLVLAEGSIILQASNISVRDQWLLSIMWKRNVHKSKNILRTSMRPEVILKEIKNLINSALDSSLQDDSVINVPVDIISNVLTEKGEILQDRDLREEVITALAPLMEKTTPSSEMVQFFSEHCLCHPRSPVVVDVFTSVVHRILKRTFDFGKSPCMRKFAADYMTALHCQNGGDDAIKNFVLSLHGDTFECPHPRVLQNLVAVNLAAIFSHFEQKKLLLTESGNEENTSQGMQQLHTQLKCHLTVFRAISEFGDWRPGLAQLLQPIPFPDDALTYDFFMDGLTPMMRRIGTDARCEVHEMLLAIREDKGGWLDVYCPSGFVCRDEGQVWCQMLETLISCCCRRKSFLQKMIKDLGALILVALRGHDVAQEILCLMLEWRIASGEDQELQIVTALQSTEKGREKYRELCKRQEHLRELQMKKGPRKLTLPSLSTDVDVAQLLSSGSFGNLECLSLAFTHVTSSCAHQLIQLPTLRCLNLWGTHFGDAGLVIIAEHLDKLQILNLCETPVTDKGIAALAGMKNLKKLNLNSTKLSPETLEMLKRKLPGLQELDVRYTDAW